MTDFLNYLILGLTRGATYALIALGYTLVYGVLQLINFAHSEVFMSGAFGSFLVVHAVVDAYKKVNYVGLTKTIQFTSSGEVEGDAVYVYKVENGKRVVLGLVSDLLK